MTKKPAIVHALTAALSRWLETAARVGLALPVIFVRFLAPVAASALRAATDVRAWFILVSPSSTIVHTRVPDLLLGLAGDPAPWPDGTSLHHTSPIKDNLTGVGLGN